MPQVHLDAVAAVPAGVHDHAVGDGADRRTDGRPVVDREVGPDAAQDRMRARVREAGRDARELERRPEEALAQRLAGRVVVPVARRALEPDAGQYPAAARVLGHQDPAVVDEGVTGVALLDQQAEAVAGARVGGEVEVRGEHVDQLQHQPRRLAGAFDRVEERTLHHTAHGFDPQVGHRFRAADPPDPVHRPGGEREPRARLVPDLDRLLPEVQHDPDGRAGTKHPEVGAVAPELRSEVVGHARLEAAARDHARERIARLHGDLAGFGRKRRARDHRGERRRRNPARRRSGARPNITMGRHGEPRKAGREQRRRRNHASLHRFHDSGSCRTRSANSPIVRVSARRPGSTPAVVAARRTTSSGSPSPPASAFARVLRRCANAARTTF